MSNAEAKIQADIVRWARDAAPHAVIFAVPNDVLSQASSGKAQMDGRVGRSA